MDCFTTNTYSVCTESRLRSYPEIRTRCQERVVRCTREQRQTGAGRQSSEPPRVWPDWHDAIFRSGNDGHRDRYVAESARNEGRPERWSNGKDPPNPRIAIGPSGLPDGASEFLVC